MSKENAGAEPRQLSVAFPLTVAAMEKGREIRVVNGFLVNDVSEPQSGGRVKPWVSTHSKLRTGPRVASATIDSAVADATKSRQRDVRGLKPTYLNSRHRYAIRILSATHVIATRFGFGGRIQPGRF
ncbi:MAG: hypothetical protein IPN69_15235 [Acidobacteria bacterium]|nr:hypothetical protein [Acidobacteriota bacterium]